MNYYDEIFPLPPDTISIEAMQEARLDYGDDLGEAGTIKTVRVYIAIDISMPNRVNDSAAERIAFAAMHHLRLTWHSVTEGHRDVPAPLRGWTPAIRLHNAKVQGRRRLDAPESP